MNKEDEYLLALTVPCPYTKTAPPGVDGNCGAGVGEPCRSRLVRDGGILLSLTVFGHPVHLKRIAKAKRQKT